MARSDNFVQIVGSVGGDPELRFTTGGIAVCSFSVAWTPRKRDPRTGEWSDGDTSWFRCSVWREMAENVAASITKGMRVVVTGSVVARDWEDRDGNKRTSVEIQVDEVAPSLRWAQAQIERTTRSSDGSAAANERASTPPKGGGGSGSGYGGEDYLYGDDEPFLRDARIGDL